MRQTRQSVFIMAAGIVSGLIFPGSSAAQQAGPPAQATEPAEANADAEVELQAMPLTGDINVDLDGQILEEFWSRATPITDFTQQEPVEGAEPTEKTEIRVVFDEDNL